MYTGLVDSPAWASAAGGTPVEIDWAIWPSHIAANSTGTASSRAAAGRRGSPLPVSGASGCRASAITPNSSDQTDRPRTARWTGVIGLIATENPKIA